MLGTSHLHQTEVRAMNADGGVKAGSHYPFQGIPQFSQSYKGEGKSKQASKSLWNRQCPAASIGTPGKNAQPCVSMEPWLGDSPSRQWGIQSLSVHLSPPIINPCQALWAPLQTYPELPNKFPVHLCGYLIGPRVSASISLLPPWLPTFRSSEK